MLLKKLTIKKTLHTFIFLFCTSILFSQTVTINTNNGASSNIVTGILGNHVSENIYLASEIGLSSFLTTGTAINKIGFELINPATAGSITFNQFNIYFKEVPAATTTISTGVYNTIGYTQVYSGIFTTGTASTWKELTLQSPFIRTSSTSNLQVLIEQKSNQIAAGLSWNFSSGNSMAGSTVISCRRYNSNTLPISGTTSLTASSFRAAIRLSHIFDKDAGISAYTLGKIPINNSGPITDSAKITNIGLTSLINVNVTLNISGANTFTSTKTISNLGIGESLNVTFDPYIPTNAGVNNYKITILDDNISNDFSLDQNVTSNTWSYLYSSTPFGSVGSTTPADFLVKFKNSSPVNLSSIKAYFRALGDQFAIVVWDASGVGGTPGILLGQSNSQTSAFGANTVTFNPTIPLGIGDFFVGVRQLTDITISLGYQVESPLRAKTFYYVSPFGSLNVDDFSAFGDSYKLMIEAKLVLPNDVAPSNPIIPNSNCFSSLQTISSTIKNLGANLINVNNVTATLKVSGANPANYTVNNVNILNVGSSEIVNFQNVNLSNIGTNTFEVFLGYALDGDTTNNISATSVNSSYSNFSSFPILEDYETTPYNFIKLIIAGSRNLLNINIGAYSNPSYPNLAPKSGNKMLIFDNYSSPNSTGVRNLVFSNCISLPANNIATNCDYFLKFFKSEDPSFNTKLDSVYVVVSTDAGLTFTRLLPGFARVNTNLASPVWTDEVVNISAYKGQTILLGFENISANGNVIMLDSISVLSRATGSISLSNLGSQTLIEDCTDQGWTYYSTPTNENVLAVEWGNNIASKAAAAVTLTLNASNGSSTSGTGLNALGTFTSKRYWNIDVAGNQPTTPVNLRFFYNPSDVSTVNADALTFQTTNAGSILETPTWFKTVAGSFEPTSGLTPNEVKNAMPLINVNTTNQTINGVLFAQFNGITSFSGGGFAAGVGIGSPLNLKIEQFIAVKNSLTVNLNWKLNIGHNAENFEIQKSIDGQNFSFLQNISASNNINSYQAIDHNLNIGANYYRLKMTDRNGAIYYSQIAIIYNGTSGFYATLTPNLIKNNTTLQISTAKTSKLNISILDIIGRTILTQNHNTRAGSQNIGMDLSLLNNGSYIMVLLNNEGAKQVIKFIKK